MWKCMICGSENNFTFCSNCGQPRTRDFTAVRTLCPVPEADWVQAIQRRNAQQVAARQEAELSALRLQMQAMQQELLKLQQENSQLRQGNMQSQQTMQQTQQTRQTQQPPQPVWQETHQEEAVQPASGADWRQNYLKDDVFPFFRPENGTFYGTIPRKNIHSITFLSSLAELPPEFFNSYTADVSYYKSGSVIMRVLIQDGKWKVYIAADGGVNARYACNRMFAFCTNLTEIRFNNSFHTDQTVSMSSVFEECQSLTSLDLSGWNTASVKNMSRMFQRCTSLVSLDLSGFNTSRVDDMSSMFFDCSSLLELDLRNFDTSQVVLMSNMFQSCKKLRKVNISSFNTLNTRSMVAMFADCYSLETVDISHFLRNKYLSADQMFLGCKAKVIR